MPRAPRFVSLSCNLALSKVAFDSARHGGQSDDINPLRLPSIAVAYNVDGAFAVNGPSRAAYCSSCARIWYMIGLLVMTLNHWV